MDLPNTGIELASSARQVGSRPLSHQGGNTLKCKGLFSAVLISKQKDLDFFPEVQNFQTCIINVRLGTKEELFCNPRGKKQHVRHDNSINMMKILICNLRNQGKNMVTIYRVPSEFIFW